MLPRFPRQIRVAAAGAVDILVGTGLLLLVAKGLVVLGQEVGVLLSIPNILLSQHTLSLLQCSGSDLYLGLPDPVFAIFW